MTRRIAPPPARPAAQRGAALLMALIIVTVISTLAVSMVWQQWRAVQVESAERTRQQSAWILNGALSWTRIILREDARPSSGKSDNLGEPWAVPLSEARISTFLAADKDNTDDAPDTFLSGGIVDAQSRFNLRNLVKVENNVPTLVPEQVLALGRLCTYLSLGAGTADLISQGMLKATPPAQSNNPTPPLMPERVAQLTWFGVDPRALKALEPYIALLPEQTAINLNTAPREVIAAALQLDLGTAERLVQVRQSKPFDKVDDAFKQLPSPPQQPGNVGTTSSYFFVTGRLRLNTQILEQRSLVHRQGTTVRAIWREWINSTEPG